MSHNPIHNSFSTLCGLAEELATTSSHSAKTQIVARHVKAFQGDLYMLLKLLLIKEDTLRTFHMAEKSLAKAISPSIGIAAADLLTSFSSLGEMGVVVHNALSSSAGSSSSSSAPKGHTLHEIDALLDAFTRTQTQADQIKLFGRFFSKASPSEPMWFVRLLCHDLRFAAGPKIILPGIHPQAFDAYRNNSDLRVVVDRVLGRSASGLGDIISSVTGVANTIKSGISVGNPVKPMLAKAVKSYEDIVAKTPVGCFAEIKYDGERIQIHKEGDTFSYWSRSLKRVTPWKTKDIEGFLPQAIAPSVTDVILDAEILCVDSTTSEPLPFQAFNKNKRALFPNAVVALFVFDVLYVDGRNMLDVPLSTRRELLESVVVPVPNRVMLSEYTLVKGDVAQLRALMQSAMAKGQEGLVLKDVSAPYAPGQRKLLKLKADYLDGMLDTVDLIVLGGWYGKGSNGGLVTTFLMGVFDPASQTFKTCTKVGNGFTDGQLAELQTSLVGALMAPISGAADIPSWLDVDSTRIPEFLIKDPHTAPIWEIFGSEFSDSPRHTANQISIRFPRVLRVRPDKDVASSTSLSDLVRMRDTSVRSLANSVTAVSGGGAPTASTSTASTSTATGSTNKRKRAPEPPTPASAPTPAPAPAPAPALAPPPLRTTLPPPQIEEHEVLLPPTALGTITAVDGDIAQPYAVQPMAGRIIFLPVNTSGRWPTKGAFGAVSRISNKAEVAYTMAVEGVRPSLRESELGGSMKMVPLPDLPGGDVFVCLAFVLGKPSSRGGKPVLNPRAYASIMSEMTSIMVASTPAASLHVHSSFLAHFGGKSNMEALAPPGITVLVYNQNMDAFQERADEQRAAREAAAAAAALPPALPELDNSFDNDRVWLAHAGDLAAKGMIGVFKKPLISWGAYVCVDQTWSHPSGMLDPTLIIALSSDPAFISSLSTSWAPAVPVVSPDFAFASLAIEGRADPQEYLV